MKGVSRDLRFGRYSIQKYHVIYIALICLSSLVVVLQVSALGSSRRSIDRYRSEIEKLNLSDSLLIKEINDAYIEDKLSKLIPEDMIFLFAEPYWDYELHLNGKIILDPYLKVSSGSNKLTIRLSESKRPSDLPAGFINKGRISGGDTLDKLSDHIRILDYSVDMHETKQSSITYVEFEVANFDLVEEVKLELSHTLSERLSFESNIITLVYDDN